MKFSNSIYIYIVLVFIFGNCSGQKRRAETVVNEFFQHWKKGDITKCASYYTVPSDVVRSKKKAELAALTSKVGLPLSHEITGFSVVDSIVRSADIVELRLLVNHEKGKSKQLFRIVVPSDDAKSTVPFPVVEHLIKLE